MKDTMKKKIFKEKILNMKNGKIKRKEDKNGYRKCI